MTPPRIAWYGDDFTGATDTLATAAERGLRALLFLGVPDARHLVEAGALDALGIAGAARAMAPDAMRVELAPVTAFFARLGPSLVHYKVCSTFDSAPEVGNIAVAVDTLASAWPTPPRVAIVGGQPSLGRHCVFGHLFARAGPDGAIHRIDRHPTMSRHPVTPMTESDLVVHLAAQGLSGIAKVARGFDPDALPDGPLLFDVLDPDDLAPIGRWLAAQSPVLAVGASSVVEAVASGSSTAPPPIAPATSPVLVVAGSLSPVTARQVAAARSYRRVDLDVGALLAGEAPIAETVDALSRGEHVLTCTIGSTTADASGADVGRATGRFLAAVLDRVPVRRIGLAGGDTSSLAMQALDAWALAFRHRLAPGVAVCVIRSDDARLDGVEVMLKGGQMGPVDLLERLIA